MCRQFCAEYYDGVWLSKVTWTDQLMVTCVTVSVFLRRRWSCSWRQRGSRRRPDRLCWNKSGGTESWPFGSLRARLNSSQRRRLWKPDYGGICILLNATSRYPENAFISKTLPSTPTVKMPHIQITYNTYTLHMHLNIKFLFMQTQSIIQLQVKGLFQVQCMCSLVVTASKNKQKSNLL